MFGLRSLMSFLESFLQGNESVCNKTVNKEGTLDLLVMILWAHNVGCKTGYHKKITTYVTPFRINDKVPPTGKKKKKLTVNSFFHSHWQIHPHPHIKPVQFRHRLENTLAFFVVVSLAKSSPCTIQYLQIRPDPASTIAKNLQYLICSKSPAWQNSSLVQISSVSVNFLTMRSSDLNLYGGRDFLYFHIEVKKVCKRYWVCKIHLIWDTDSQCWTVSFLSGNKNELENY